MDQLKQLFPEAVNEDGIDLDVLANLLGRHEERKECFNFTWAGKQDAILGLHNRSRATLKPVPEESVNWDSTGHVFIEGDNLEVMKLLYKSYFGRVKMIYIDPPYNTGNEFVYPDNYAEPLANYLQLTGQVDEEGNLQTSAVDRAGRRHSGWLSMIYPRLFLARQLLRDDGVIYVSIDDNEVHNLRMLMNEVFGEENFVAEFVWQARQSKQNDTDLSINHEYILTYARKRRVKDRRLKEKNASVWYHSEDFAFYPLPADKSRFSNDDNDPRGPWKLDPFDAPNIRENLTYQIVNHATGQVHLPPPGRCWRTNYTRYQSLLDDGRIVFGKSGSARPALKVFFSEKKDFGETPTTWLAGSEFETATHATKTLQDLFEGVSPFETIKPVSLLKHFVRLSTRKDDIVMDYFAGSASTAHAVLEQNRGDGGKRKFIMVQLPVLTGHAEYLTLAEVGKERIRRVIQQMQGEREETEDLGFRVFRLDQSPLRQWQELSARNTGADDYAAQMELFVNDPLLDGWTVNDVIAEVAIKEAGFSLSYCCQRVAAVTEQSVYRVVDDERGQYFYICLDEELSFDGLGPLELGTEDLFIFRDCAASDTLVANLALTCRIRSI